MEQKENDILGDDDFHVKPARSFWHEIYEWIDSAVITVMCLLVILTFVVRQVRIDGSSMENTLFNNDRVVVSDVFYTPKYGDIVVISSEVYDNVPIIKRVIAVGGEWVDIKDGNVYVGKSRDNMKSKGSEFIDNKYTDPVLSDGFYGEQNYPLLVPDGYVFVLGDNRAVSLDSRTLAVGLIDERQILGKAFYRVFPFDSISKLN